MDDELAMAVLSKILHGMSWVELRSDGEGLGGFLVIDGSMDLTAEESALVTGIMEHH